MEELYSAKTMGYHVRAATLDDLDTLVRHRVARFTDMRGAVGGATLGPGFAAWLREQRRAGAYRAWLVEDASGDVVAGGGATIIPWPPGPQYGGTRLAFVYNVYTEPAHRR